MKLTKKKYTVIRWTARILGTAVILFGLPFYFGYGNPLPFINPDNSLLDNLWLSIFPLMFIGLGLGWKFEKIGGFLVTISLMIGLIVEMMVEHDFIFFMLVPLMVGVLYLVSAYRKE